MPNHPTITVDSFAGLADLWSRTRQDWSWPCLFVLPFWLETVCRHLGSGGDPYILTVHDGREPIGSMPLAIDGTTARFLGSHEVCDYQDLICAPGKHERVLETTIGFLSRQGIRRLDLRTLRPDAAVLTALTALSACSLVADEVTYETVLPDSWEEYMLQLNGKQRHEVRRKLRRLGDHGAWTYRCVGAAGSADPAVETFLRLFRRNRPDKEAFMTDAMEAYFRGLIETLSGQGLLRLGFLDVNGQPVACVLCVDYRDIRYLYNSGYDEQFEPLSVGALSKVLSIRNGIEAGCRRYDFLKGAENYKRRLGGREIALFRCVLDI